MSEISLAQIREVNRERCKRWHPPETEPWSGADWSNAMCGEAGEAANVVKKIRRIETRTASYGYTWDSVPVGYDVAGSGTITEKTPHFAAKGWYISFHRTEPFEENWTGFQTGEHRVPIGINRFGLVYGEKGPSKLMLVQQLADELADTFCYMDLLADFYGIDLLAAIVTKFNQVSVREGFPERLQVEEPA